MCIRTHIHGFDTMVGISKHNFDAYMFWRFIMRAKYMSLFAGTTVHPSVRKYLMVQYNWMWWSRSFKALDGRGTDRKWSVIMPIFVPTPSLTEKDIRDKNDLLDLIDMFGFDPDINHGPQWLINRERSLEEYFGYVPNVLRR